VYLLECIVHLCCVRLQLFELCLQLPLLSPGCVQLLLELSLLAFTLRSDLRDHPLLRLLDLHCSVLLLAANPLSRELVAAFDLSEL
jgi:hypothetical protein